MTLARPRLAKPLQHFRPDLIAVAADRRSQVDSQVGRNRSLQDLEGTNSLFYDPREGSTPACVEQGKSPGFGFEQKDWNAVRGRHREQHPGSVRCQPVCIAGDAHAQMRWRIYDDHPFSVNLAADDARPASETSRQRLETFRYLPGGAGTGEPIVRRGDRGAGYESWKLVLPLHMDEQIRPPYRPRCFADQQGGSTFSISAPSARKRTSIRS